MSDIISSAPSALPTDPAMLALLQAGQARRSRNRAAAARAEGSPAPLVASTNVAPLTPRPSGGEALVSDFAEDLPTTAQSSGSALEQPRVSVANGAEQLLQAEKASAAGARSETEALAVSPSDGSPPSREPSLSLVPETIDGAQAVIVGAGESIARIESVTVADLAERSMPIPVVGGLQPIEFAKNASFLGLAGLAGQALGRASAETAPASTPSAHGSSDLSAAPGASREAGGAAASARLAMAKRLAQSAGLQTAFTGPRAPEQRSIWRHARWAIGAAALVATLAAAAFVHHSTPGGPGATAKSAPPAWSHAGALTAAQPATTAKAPAAVAHDKNLLAPLGYGSAVIPQPVAPALLALPIPIDDANPLSEHELAVALLPKDPFLALAVTVERLRTKSYYDVAGANIGMGYCVPMRLAVYGKARVTQDFEQAGMSREQISDMLSGNRKKVLGVEITQSEALRLLMITKSDYVELARNVAGAKAFASMSLERQTALTYLAYNSNIGQFSQLASALAHGHDLEAMGEMVPSFRMSADAPLQKNYRLGSYLWAAWTGTLSDAIGNPMRHEGLYANENGLSSFQRAYGLTKKVGAKAKAKFAAPVSSVQATTSSALPQATLAGVGAPAQVVVPVANVMAKTASAAPANSAKDAPAPAAVQERTSAKASSTAASAPAAANVSPAAAAGSVGHPTAHDALPKSLASAPALPRAKLVAPPSLSSEQARALRARLANRRQAVAAPAPAAPVALSQANASAAARARLLEQADQNLDSAPSRPGM